jgi:aminoglycoside phosphotransferase family enzyme/predicted kinase
LDVSTGADAVVETHVSVLFFLEDVVLKVKKPVRHPFVDFRSLEARRRACEEEVRCNARLAPDVYLGVADTTLDGRTLDHAVVMRRLPAERCLEAMVRRGDPGVGTALEEVASVLASFHRRAARSGEIDQGGALSSVLATWGDLVEELAPFAGRAVAAAELAEADRLARRFLAGRSPLLAARIDAGRVCDGHGDILAADVFLLDDGPRILDAVEFDPRLRHIDVAADVAFLAMDLERLGAPADAAQFVAHYEAAAHDVFPPSLFHYYCAQRAMVRALVACLRDVGHGEPAALVDLALRHLRATRLVLGVVSGLPGTGKSTVAAAVGERLGWAVLRSDEVRRELFGAWGGGRPLMAPVGAGPYGPDATDRTYDTLVARARQHLGLGRSVVLDAGFRDDRWRDAAQALAEDVSAELVVVETSAPLALAEARADRRLQAGTDVSGAGRAVVAALAEHHHRWPGAAVVDTSTPDPSDALARVEALFDGRDVVSV